MKAINVIFPHQLFKESPLLKSNEPFYLIEEFLFFKHYKFHKQKILFHRCSMKKYESFLTLKIKEVFYINADDPLADIRHFITHMRKLGITCIQYLDPVDDWLQRRISKGIIQEGMTSNCFESPLFINTKNELADFFKKSKKKYHQTSFYIEQRKKNAVLLDENNQPLGGKWTFDTENRKKYPAKKIPPNVVLPKKDDTYSEAYQYTLRNFNNHYGDIMDNPLYPSCHKSAEEWLDQFLEHRFYEFGPYEDAIHKEFSILNHSVLTPMMNVGLLTPKQVLNKSIKYGLSNNVAGINLLLNNGSPSLLCPDGYLRVSLVSISVAQNALPAGAGSINILLTHWCPAPPGFVVALMYRPNCLPCALRKRDLI